MSYRRKIEALAPAADARHVEAWMRSEHGTLDALNTSEFLTEVRAAAACARADGALSEQLAQSYGL